MWGENTLAWGFKSPTCAVLRAGGWEDILPQGWDPQVNSAGLGLAVWAGAHGIPPRAALRRGKDAHIGERSLRALSFCAGGERTAGTRQQVTASIRKLPPLEAGVASSGPPAAERPLMASSTSAKMMLGHSSIEECSEAQTPMGREPVPQRDVRRFAGKVFSWQIYVFISTLVGRAEVLGASVCICKLHLSLLRVSGTAPQGCIRQWGLLIKYPTASPGLSLSLEGRPAHTGLGGTVQRANQFNWKHKTD